MDDFIHELKSPTKINNCCPNQDKERSRYMWFEYRYDLENTLHIGKSENTIIAEKKHYELKLQAGAFPFNL